MENGQDFEVVEQPQTSGSNAGTAILAVIVIAVIIFATWYIYQGELGGGAPNTIQYKYSTNVTINETIELSNVDLTIYPDTIQINMSTIAPFTSYLGYNYTISGTNNSNINQHWSFKGLAVGDAKVCFLDGEVPIAEYNGFDEYYYVKITVATL